VSVKSRFGLRDPGRRLIPQGILFCFRAAMELIRSLRLYQQTNVCKHA